MRRNVIIATAALGALVVAGCSSGGSSSSSSSSAATKSCVATIGIEGPLTGPVAVLGQEQLHFAQLALLKDNLANQTKITLVQGDTQLNPAQATTVTQQFTSNPKIVAVVGPAGSQEVQAVGPLFARAGMAFISGSATAAALTTGKYPTFFRIVSKDSVQGPQDANYIVNTLHPKALMIVDDQEAYSTGLVSAMMPIFKAAGIKVDHESVSQKTTDFSSLVAKVTPATTVVVLPWQVAANAQQFGRNLAQQHKKAVIFGTDGLFSPGTFTINGSYVSSFGPDITAIPADTAIAAAREDEVRVLRHVRPAGVRGDARDRRGHRLGLQVRPDAEPGQRAGSDQEDERADLDPRAADQVRLPRRPGQRQVLPVQDRLDRQVQPDPERLTAAEYSTSSCDGARRSRAGARRAA